MVDPRVEGMRRGEGEEGFCEGVANIGTVDALVLYGAKSEEKAQVRLFHTGGIGVIKSTNLATTSGTVTGVEGVTSNTRDTRHTIIESASIVKRKRERVEEEDKQESESPTPSGSFSGF
jgi:hypothetical protein